MDFTLESQEFAKALSRVSGVVDRKTTMPILENILLTVEKGSGLRLAATDLDISVVTEVSEADIKEGGTIAVNARRLLEIVKAMGPGPVRLQSAKNQTVRITSGKTDFQIMTQPPEDFPALPKVENISTAAIDPPELLDMLKRASYCVSTDDIRYHLTGLFFEAGKDDTLKAVATDGHRLALAQKKIPGSGKIGLKDGVIMPRKGITELRKLLEENPPSAAIGVSAPHAVYKTPGTTLMMRLLDGKFPAYQQVIPDRSNRGMRVSREDFMEALRRVSLLLRDNSQGVLLQFAEDKLVIEAENPEIGHGKCEVEIEFMGEIFQTKVGFNARYLLDAAGSFTDAEVTFELTDELSPGVIRGVEDPEAGLGVVMPMRI